MSLQLKLEMIFQESAFPTVDAEDQAARGSFLSCVVVLTGAGWDLGVPPCPVKPLPKPLNFPPCQKGEGQDWGSTGGATLHPCAVTVVLSVRVGGDFVLILGSRVSKFKLRANFPLNDWGLPSLTPEKNGAIGLGPPCWEAHCASLSSKLLPSLFCPPSLTTACGVNAVP